MANLPKKKDDKTHALFSKWWMVRRKMQLCDSGRWGTRRRPAMSVQPEMNERPLSRRSPVSFRAAIDHVVDLPRTHRARRLIPQGPDTLRFSTLLNDPKDLFCVYYKKGKVCRADRIKEASMTSCVSFYWVNFKVWGLALSWRRRSPFCSPLPVTFVVAFHTLAPSC